MKLSDSFLFDAGWLFFGAWSVVVALVGWIAFGRDLLPSKAQIDRESRPESTHPKARLH